jgi:Fe2+ transport system protein FeoA
MSGHETGLSTAPATPCETPLSALSAASLAQVVDVVAEADDAVRLKSLGICVGRRIQLVKGGDPLIVRVLGARVGLSARLATGVVVRPLD